MKRKRLKALLDYYQPLLGLSDWEIALHYRDYSEMDGRAGLVSWSIPLKQATITIARADTLPGGDFPSDVEETLVHELIHLHSALFDTFEVGSHEDNALEVMINKLSKAIVALKRG